MPSVVSPQYSLLAGVIDALAKTWEQPFPEYDSLVKLMALTLPQTSLRTAPYAFKESVGFPIYWPIGEPRSAQGFKDRVIEITNRAYEMTITWNIFNKIDDQLKDLLPHVQTAVQRYKLLPIILMSEYLNGVPSYNPSLQNCYDGAVLYSATDGDGANRLGVSGGNIVTGDGLDPSGVLKSLAKAQRRFLEFKDPTGEKPIFDEASVDYTKLTIIGPPAANEVLQRASKSEYLRVDPLNTVSESNFMKGTFKYYINPFLTDSSDLFVFAEHPYWKAFAYRAPKSPEVVFGDKNNSDRARWYNEEGIYTDIRLGIAPFFCASTVKINN